MSTQSASFILSLLCGFAVMILWDMLYGVRQAAKCGIAANVLLDILWWSGAAVMFAWCLWNTNNLAVRGFNVFALLASACLYHITVSKYIKRLFCVIFYIFLKIIRFILKILLTPAVFLYKILIRPFINLCKKIFGKRLPIRRTRVTDLRNMNIRRLRMNEGGSHGRAKRNSGKSS